jgi:excisionase family DNA binding protein
MASKYGPEHSDLLTVREVAQTLRVEEVTVRRWIKSGVLEEVRLPRPGKKHTYRVHKRTLDALMQETEQ